MLAPIGIFIGMEQYVARKFQRNHLVHVAETGFHIFEIADPHVVLHRIFHQPGPRAFADFFISSGVTLIEADQFIKQHDWLNDVGGIREHPGAAVDAAIARETAVRPGRIAFIAWLEIFGERFSATNRSAQILRVSRHFVETKIRVAIFADHMGLDEILSVIAPTGVAAATRIRGRIRYLSPRVALRS